MFASLASSSSILSMMLLVLTSSRKSCSATKSVAPLNEKALYNLGKYYMDGFIRPFFRWRDEMCSDLRLPRRLPPAEELRKLKHSVRKGQRPNIEPTDYETARIYAMIRDNFHCMVSGKLDTRCDYLEVLGQRPEKCTWVLCFFICGWGEPRDFRLLKPGDMETRSTFWNILTSFGFPELCSELEGRNVYRLDNVMSVGVDVLYMMYNLRTWFEEIKGKANHYVVHSVDERDYQKMDLAREVDFVAEASALPLPNPKYLHIHAGCAKVAHLSGAGRYLFEVEDILEESDNEYLSD